MCVICVGLNADDRPSVRELTQACINNPDGFGYGVVYDSEHGRGIYSFRTMDPEQAIMSYFNALDFWGDKVVGHMFHARIATRGAIAVTGCHPFQVADDSDSMLAHNGMFRVNIDKDDPRVDSQVFAEDILPKFGGVAGLSEGYNWDVLDGFVQHNNSKVVILNSIHKDVPVLILGESLGHWDKQSGLWWSGYSYKSYPQSGNYATGIYGHTPRLQEAYDTFESTWDDVPGLTEVDEKNIGLCVSCEEIMDSDEGICYSCGICQECFDTWSTCRCTLAL
jgi:hypothetical protein